MNPSLNDKPEKLKKNETLPVDQKKKRLSLKLKENMVKRKIQQKKREDYGKVV